MNPTVSFVVPCYKLAHLLSECVNSILTQTYSDFEVLIMDDCSPDSTPEVARSFADERVKHIRNNPNLGHLRNYNKGIDLARGKYVWLISADDRLRGQAVLEQYVRLMESNPRVGFVFCPAMGLRDGHEAGILDWTSCGPTSQVWRGQDLLKKLAVDNCVAAASGLVRKECYDRLGAFPLDLPYAGDWYMWALFALHFDVGYFAEPMVNYRLHEESMTTALGRRNRMLDIIEVLWRLKAKCEEQRQFALADISLSTLLDRYAFSITEEQLVKAGYGITLQECEQSLSSHARDSGQLKLWLARLYTGMGDAYYQHGHIRGAGDFYQKALESKITNVPTWAKLTLLKMGAMGTILRPRITSKKAHQTAGAGVLCSCCRKQTLRTIAPPMPVQQRNR